MNWTLDPQSGISDQVRRDDIEVGWRQGLGRWFSKFAVLKADISNPPRNGEVARSDGGVPTPHLHGPSRPWGPSAPLGHLPVPGRISAGDKFSDVRGARQCVGKLPCVHHERLVKTRVLARQNQVAIMQGMELIANHDACIAAAT
jgi:hypothetical protein